MTDKRGVLAATFIVLASACCFGSIAPLTTLAMRDGAALQGVQAWRYVTSALLLALFAWLRGNREPAPTPGVRPWWHPVPLMVAGTGQASVATLALLALRWLPAAATSFLFYTYPVWVTIITTVRGAEPLTGTRVLALLLAVGGVAAMVGAPDTASLHPTGVAIALGAALLYAAYIPVLGALQRQRQPLDVARGISTGGALIFVTWSLATNALWTGFHAVSIGASVLQGVLSAAAFVGFLAGLSRLGAVRTAITSTIEPFWTTLLGALLLAQPAGIGTLFGGIGIMGAVVLLQRPVAPGSVPPGSVPLAPSRSSTPRTGNHEGGPLS